MSPRLELYTPTRGDADVEKILFTQKKIFISFIQNTLQDQQPSSRTPVCYCHPVAREMSSAKQESSSGSMTLITRSKHLPDGGNSAANPMFSPQENVDDRGANYVASKAFRPVVLIVPYVHRRTRNFLYSISVEA